MIAVGGEQLPRARDIPLAECLIHQVHISNIKPCFGATAFFLSHRAQPRLGLFGALGFFAQTALFTLGGHGTDARRAFADESNRGDGESHYKGEHDTGRCRERELVAANQFLKAIGGTGRPRDDRLVPQVALDVHCQGVGSFVTTGAVLLEALHHDPVEVTANDFYQRGNLRAVRFGDGHRFRHAHRAEASRRPLRFILANFAAHLIKAGTEQLIGVQWCLTGE